MDDRFEDANCAVCGKRDAQVFIRGAGPAQIVKCRHDSLVYMSPRPKAELVRKLHTTFVRNDNLEIFDRYRREILSREAEAVKRLKPGGNLLDIGCATGVFFDSFMKGNWRLYGVDTAPLGVSIARTKQGAEVFNGTLREAQYPSGFFDVVSILDTLYYDPDPRATLIEIQRILKDDGLLAVEVPGFTHTLLRNRGPLCWLLDRKWTKGYAASSHLYYFSPRSLRLLLEASGFRVLKMIPEQASLGRGGLVRSLNELHFALARLLFTTSGGRLSVAGKELYLAVKASPALPEQTPGSSV
jgi:SAM-dependent methyltransferase